MTNRTPTLLDVAGAGLLGSLAMTICHESARRLIPAAPRLDSIGRRGLAWAHQTVGETPPATAQLQAEALVGDLIGNAGLFASTLAIGPPRSAAARVLAVSALAGWATLAVPPRLKIGPRPDQLRWPTQAMTIGLYLLGGGVAALVYEGRRRDRGGS